MLGWWLLLVSIRSHLTWKEPPMRRWTAAAAACALTLALGTVPPASAAPGSTLRAAMDGSGVDTLNPFLAFFDGALELFGNVYPSLNSLQPDGQPGPYLATSWTPSEDRKTWTFKLREGLKWSDGQPLTSEDAAWTLNLIMTDSVAGTANGSLVSNFDSVTAPDPATLVIKTKAPQANVPYVSIPMRGIPIVPKHVFESHAKDLKDYKNDTFPMVGYGPWTLTDYKQEQYAKYEANKSFVLGAPKFDHLVEQSFKSTDAAVAALRSGQLDFVTAVNPTQFNAVKGDKKLQAVQTVGNGWVGLEINHNARTRSGKKIGTGDPRLGDPALRKAIALGTDRQTLVTKVIDGVGQVGAGYLPPAWPQWFWKPAEVTPYDPAQANKVLDDAGYAKGADGIRVKDGKPLAFRLGIHSDDSADAAITNYLVGWMKAIGIKLNVQSLSMSALNSDLAKGDWDLLMDAWTTGPDPTYLLGIQSCSTLPKDDGTGGNTDSFFCDETYDKLFKQQLTTFDQTERGKVIGQMQDILYKANVNQIYYYANRLDVARADTVSGLIVGQQNGEGLYPAQSTFWSYLKATPATATTAAKAESGNSGLLWGGAAVVVIVLGLGVVVLRRRAGKADRE
ncbi:MAG: ABC transporter substrate-binding protein [Nonomuraea sp.]|nr:ABC transporter substrate-binding protein [Nonomuraea sp.]